MNMMCDPGLAVMLPFDNNRQNYELKQRLIFKMPRVVLDQKRKFETDDLFRKLNRDGEICFAYLPPPPNPGAEAEKTRSQVDLKFEFAKGCREGILGVTFTSIGVTTTMTFRPQQSFLSDASYYSPHSFQNLANFGGEVDFDKEHGKVHIKSVFIMNGVCVRFRGWLDIERLNGRGRLDYDEKTGSYEDVVLQEQLKHFSQMNRF